MPSQTSAKNLPYPLGTDRLMDGDDQIRKLAQSVDNMVQAGKADVNVTTGGTYTTLSVTFPVAYSAPPAVVISAQGTSPNVGALVGQAPTATAFLAAAVRATAGILSTYWVAVGPITAVS